MALSTILTAAKDSKWSRESIAQETSKYYRHKENILPCLLSALLDATNVLDKELIREQIKQL